MVGDIPCAAGMRFCRERFSWERAMLRAATDLKSGEARPCLSVQEKNGSDTC